MNSLFKFLRRVRIHGGECGAVARALHHEAQKVALIQAEQSLISDECVFLGQADSGKALGPTFIERKQMSTKTTFKRIALVAVASLGFGVLTSVAPATAADGRVASAITIGAAPSFKSGQVNIIPITVTYPSANVSGDTTTVTVQITKAPSTGGNANAASVMGSGSTAGSNGTNGAGSRLYFVSDSIGTQLTGGTLEDAPADGSPDAAIADAKGIAGQLDGNGISEGGAGEVHAAAFSVASSASGVTTKTVYLAVKPDLSGDYSILVASNATGRTYYVAGDTTATATLATTGTVATAKLTAMNTSPVGANPNGVVLKVELTDSAGLGTQLGSLETLQLTSTSASDTFSACDDANCTGAVTNGTLTSSMFVNGVGFFKVANSGTADTTSTITLANTGTLSNTINVTASAVFKAEVDLGTTTAANTVTVGYGATTGYSGTVSQTANWAMNRSSTATSSALKFTFAAAAAAAGVAPLTVTDTNKKIFGNNAKAAIAYTPVISWAAAATSASLSISHSALGTSSNTYTVTIASAASGTVGVSTGHVVTVTGSAAVTSGTNTITATPAGPINVAAKGKITINAQLLDQFGLAIKTQTVTASVSGRNTVAATSLVTDADGFVTFSYTDAGTISANDTVTFTNTLSNTATDTVTVSFSSTAVSTVTISGGNYSAGVLSQTVSTKDISAGDGAEVGVQAITATIKDANGALMVGVPVTFGVTGTGVAITSTTASGYTGATGVATAQVYAWIAGTYEYTATAGAVTSKGTITFGQTATGEERTISVKDNGNGIITATAKDRFGNPVPGTTIYGTGTGSMTINGKTKDSGTTGNDGNLDFVVTGAGTFAASTISWSAAAGTYGSGQTSAPKGYLANSSSATTLATYALTAYAAGTTTVDEEGVGASYDAAGVATATVAVNVADAAADAANAATDAAAEAIDAANAATDAANLAAEAADAATVAAEEARDAADAATAAVEELATQVATLMAALKAQITTLANTVAKIAKKVKA